MHTFSIPEIEKNLSNWYYRNTIGGLARRLEPRATAEGSSHGMTFMHFVYVLKSKKDDNLYIGCTNDVEKRIKEHNQGRVYSTKPRRPLALVYVEEYADKYNAFRAEREYKTAKGKRLLKAKILNWGIV